MVSLLGVYSRRLRRINWLPKLGESERVLGFTLTSRGGVCGRPLVDIVFAACGSTWPGIISCEGDNEMRTIIALMLASVLILLTACTSISSGIPDNLQVIQPKDITSSYALQIMDDIALPGGRSSEATSHVPDNAIISVEARGSASYMILPDSSLWAWGGNYWGTLGDGTTERSQYPIRLMNDVSQVSAGMRHTAAITTDENLYTWGYNDRGQLGDGSTIPQLRPMRIMCDIAQVSAGSFYTMAVRTDGSLWAWGVNANGQLGDGTTTERHSPVRIMDDVAYVSAGRWHTMAIRTDGSLWAWGANSHGQLGNDSTTYQLSPVKIMDSVAAVSAGEVHTMAIGTDGVLWAWGENWHGQLGDGTHTNRHIPIMIMEDAAQVSARWHQTMVIKTDGSLWAWGKNYWGQLGDGSATGWLEHSSVPARIMYDAVQVSAGVHHTVAVRADGSLWVWGLNREGQFGVSTLEYSNVPVRIMDDMTGLSDSSAPVLSVE